MKNSQYLFTAVVIALLFSSCGSLSISQKRYSRGLNIDWFAKKDEKKSVPAEKNRKKAPAVATVDESRQDAEIAQVEPAVSETPAVLQQPANVPAVASAKPVHQKAAKATRPELSRKEVRQIAKSARQQMKSIDKLSIVPSETSETNDVSTILLVILCIIAPLGILAVFLHEGEINEKFLISILLHLLFILPGIIYSLLVVLDAI